MFLLIQVFGAVQDRLGEQTGFNIMTADFEARIIFKCMEKIWLLGLILPRMELSKRMMADDDVFMTKAFGEANLEMPRTGTTTYKEYHVQNIHWFI